MINVEFAVLFRRIPEETTRQASNSVARSVDLSDAAGRLKPEPGEEGRTAARSHDGNVTMIEGVARSYDVRNKVLYVDEVGESSILGATTGAAACSTARDSGSAERKIGGASAPTKLDGEGHSKGRRIAEDRCHRRCARHILDVKLLACLCPQGEELFKQLQAFSCAFEEDLARASLDLAVDAAADLGASCRWVFDDFVNDLLKGEVTMDALREEKLAVSAEGAAVSAVATVLRAAQRAVIARCESRRGIAKIRNMNFAAAAGAVGINAEIGKENLRRARARSSAVSLDQDRRRGVKRDPGAKGKDGAVAVDKSIAARMRFRCTTIVRERRHKAPGGAVEGAVPGNRRQTTKGMSSEVIRHDRRRHDLQYLARWT